MQVPLAPVSSSIASGSRWRIVLKLATPTVAAMLAQSVVNEIDILFFAYLPCPESSNAQAALLPSLIVLWLFGGSLSSISVGTQALTGRRFAEGNHAGAGGVVKSAFAFTILAGIIFSVLGYWAMPGLLASVIKAPGALLAAEQYMSWRLLGVTSMAATFALKAFFDGIGKTHVHFVASVVMNILNVVLCYLLIFGFPALGIPKLGIAGAGIAGCVATYTGLFVMCAYAVKPEYRVPFRLFHLDGISMSVLRPMLGLSIPSAIATIVVMTGFGLFAAIAGRLDAIQPMGSVSAACPGGQAEPVSGAAMTVIVGVLKLTFTACLAFGTSTATLVSQCLGAKDPERAEAFGWTSVKLGALIFGIVGLLEALFAGPILQIASRSQAVQEVALVPLQMMALATPLIAFGMILTQALFGAGNSKFVMLVEVALHFAVLVPLAWLLGITLGLGLIGIWAAALVYVALLCVAMAWKFRSGDWKSIQL